MGAHDGLTNVFESYSIIISSRIRGEQNYTLSNMRPYSIHSNKQTHYEHSFTLDTLQFAPSTVAA